jgi:hypothetical protein
MNTGKADDDGRTRAKRLPSILPGYWRWHACTGDQTQHGKPPAVIRNMGSNWQLARDRLDCQG